MTGQGRRRQKVAVIGGAGETRALCAAIAARREFFGEVWLAQPLRPGPDLALPEGQDGPASRPGAGRRDARIDDGARNARDASAAIAAWLERLHPDRVVLAVHPFAAPRLAWLGPWCAARGLAASHLCRPPWQAGPRDRWTEIAEVAAAAALVPAGARVFVGLGREALPDLSALPGRYLLVRRRGAPDPSASDIPLPVDGAWLCGAPPFSEADERAMLQDHAVDWLLVRNAGGPGGWPKLAAARSLGLPVALVARPDRLPGLARVSDVAGAVQWLGRRAERQT